MAKPWVGAPAWHLRKHVSVSQPAGGRPSTFRALGCGEMRGEECARAMAAPSALTALACSCAPGAGGAWRAACGAAAGSRRTTCSRSACSARYTCAPNALFLFSGFQGLSAAPAPRGTIA